MKLLFVINCLLLLRMITKVETVPDAETFCKVHITRAVEAEMDRQLNLRTEPPQPILFPRKVSLATVPQLNVEQARDFSNVSICMALQCGIMSGIGSKLVAVAMIYHLANPLGFKLYVQDALTDPPRNVVEPDRFSAILQPHLFRPAQCSYTLGAYDQQCQIGHVYGLMSAFRFEMYDILMFEFLRDHYLPTLREAANTVYSNIQKLHPNAIMVGAQIRMDEFDDDRLHRKLSKADYDYLIEHQFAAARSTSKGPRLLLVQGDKGIRHYANQPNVLLLEDYVRREYPAISSLAAQFVSMDVASRLRFRVLNRFSNTYTMILAFHKLNGNTKGLAVADVFSMRILSYEERIISDLNDGRFNRHQFERNAMGPYVLERNNVPMEQFAQCWVKELNTMRVPPLAPCMNTFLKTEVGALTNR